MTGADVGADISFEIKSFPLQRNSKLKYVVETASGVRDVGRVLVARVGSYGAKASARGKFWNPYRLTWSYKRNHRREIVFIYELTQVDAGHTSKVVVPGILFERIFGMTDIDWPDSNLFWREKRVIVT